MRTMENSGHKFSGEVLGLDGQVPVPSEATRWRSTLNPFAPEFHPRQVPEEGRTMLVTFPRMDPLYPQEIAQFFYENLGIPVQNVVIHGVHDGSLPQVGRVVFRSSLAIPRIMEGKVIQKFTVHGKQMWAHKHVATARRAE